MEEKNNSQQPEVLACQGGGEYTDDGHALKSGSESGGTISQYPLVDTTRNIKEQVGGTK